MFWVPSNKIVIRSFSDTRNKRYRILGKDRYQIILKFRSIWLEPVISKKSFKTILHIEFLANYLQRCIGYIWGKRWRSWLRHCATSRKVACWIPDGVIGIFHGHNSSGHTMAVGVDSAFNRNDYQECFL